MELSGHMGVIIAADWMADGCQVITASWDRSAILFDADTGEQIITLTGRLNLVPPTPNYNFLFYQDLIFSSPPFFQTFDLYIITPCLT